MGALAAILFHVGIFHTWSERVTDRLFLPASSDPSILIVAIDDASIAEIGRWPWPRSVHASLIGRLSGARVIGYDVAFAEPSDPVDDAQLKTAIERHGNVILPVELRLTRGPYRYAFDPDDSVTPLSELSVAAQRVGHTNTPPDPDGVVRRIPLIVPGPDGSEIPAFAMAAFEAAGGRVPITDAPADRYDQARVHYANAPGRSFQTVSAADVLRGRVDSSVITDRTVFVGATAPDLHDVQLVPTSRGVPMSGVEIHASLYDTIARRAWLASLPVWITSLFILVLSFLIGAATIFCRARWSAAVAVLLSAGVVIVAVVAFERGKIIEVVWPVLAIFAAYAAVTVERRVTADRERAAIRSAFSRYVSEPVVNQILAHPEALRLGGEKREMTVLFSDLRGFTSLSESIPAEQLVDTLNTYLTRMTQIVFDHGGVLDKYIGDAVMAFWNAPFDQPDHAERAVRCAVAMRDALDAMNAEKTFPGDVVLKMGIGINTGDMTVGNFGGEARFDYTVIGDAVNLAARIETATKEYGAEILISESTYHRVSSLIRARRVGEATVKGKTEPVVLYKVFGLKE